MATAARYRHLKRLRNALHGGEIVLPGKGAQGGDFGQDRAGPLARTMVGDPQHAAHHFAVDWRHVLAPVIGCVSHRYALFVRSPLIARRTMRPTWLASG